MYYVSTYWLEKWIEMDLLEEGNEEDGGSANKGWW